MIDPKTWMIVRENRHGKPSILILDQNGNELMSVNSFHADREHVVQLIMRLRETGVLPTK